MIKNIFHLLKLLLIRLNFIAFCGLNREITKRNNRQKNLSLHVQKIDNLFILKSENLKNDYS